MDRQAGRFCAELAWVDLIEKVSWMRALSVSVRRGEVEECREVRAERDKSAN